MASSFNKTSNHTLRDVLAGYLYTGIFCASIGLMLWFLGVTNPLWASLLVSFCIGLSINTAVLICQPLFLRFMSEAIAPIPTTIIGVGVGLVLAGSLTIGKPLYFFTGDWGGIILGLFFGVLGFLFFGTRAKLIAAQQELSRAEAEQLTQEKQQLETQLRLLQAQIEPHFLFNTLSNIAGMIHDQPETAEKTLLHLTTLLRATLRRTRDRITTFGDELEIIKALLSINKIRMGERLEYTLEIEDALLDAAFPPMLLQPLVENAIKHGLEPLESGGTITISITRCGVAVCAEVADTGQGIDATNRNGTGINNVQGRLTALFGAEGKLELHENTPQGMIARITIPAKEQP